MPTGFFNTLLLLLFLVLLLPPLPTRSSSQSRHGKPHHKHLHPPPARSTDEPPYHHHHHQGMGQLDITCGSICSVPPVAVDRTSGGDYHQQNERRAGSPVTIALKNGVARNLNIQYGELQYWYLSAQEIYGGGSGGGGGGESSQSGSDELRKRDVDKHIFERRSDPKVVNITLNTCLQPQFNYSFPLEAPLPQLQLYVSNNSTIQIRGPTVPTKPQTAVPIIQGFGSVSVVTTGSISVGVYAVDMSQEDQKKYQGPWNYEIAMSTSDQYHDWQQGRNLYLIDSDDSAALLITGNMTNTNSQDKIDKLMSADPPYVLFAQNTQFPAPFRGLERSYCAISKLPQLNLANVETSLTQRGLGSLPKQQFHLSGLNKSSTYLAYLAKPPSNSSRGGGGGGGGGVLWEPISFNTKSEGNCQIVYDLPFCSEVAYSVPANPTIFTTPSQLGLFYDNIAQMWYRNFSYSLQQVPCNSTDLTLRYSFTRDCNDCAAAYKTWLCAVSIPRCADLTSKLPYLAYRGLDTEFFNQTSNSTVPNDAGILFSNNSDGSHSYNTASLRSRNSLIESMVRPGPYKEIKPCIDLCWSLVQSCPSDFKFTCPMLGSWGAEMSYGQRSQDGDITCSWLGAAYFLSGGRRTLVSWSASWVVSWSALGIVVHMVW